MYVSMFVYAYTHLHTHTCTHTRAWKWLKLWEEINLTVLSTISWRAECWGRGRSGDPGSGVPTPCFFAARLPAALPWAGIRVSTQSSDTQSKVLYFLSFLPSGILSSATSRLPYLLAAMRWNVSAGEKQKLQKRSLWKGTILYTDANKFYLN